MKARNRKIMALVLSLMMVFSATSTGWAVSDVDKAKLYLKISEYFGTTVKDTNAQNLYTYIDALDNGVLTTKVTNQLNADSALKARLAIYDFDTAAIVGLISDAKGQFPSTLNALKTDGNANIFGELYAESGVVSATKLKTAIKNISQTLYDNTPSKFTTEFARIYTSPSSDVFYEALDVAITKKMGTLVYDSYTGYYTINLSADTSLLTDIQIALGHSLNGGVDIADSNSFSQVFYDLAVVVIAAMEDVAKENQATENAIGKVLDEIGYVTKTTVNSKPSSSGGSSNNNNNTPTPTPTPPATDLNKEDEKDVAELGDLVPQAGTESTDKEQEAMQDKANEVIAKLAEGAATDTNADKQVKELNKTMTKIIESLNSEKAAEVVEKQAELADKVLDNPNVTAAEAKDVVKDLIRTNVKALVAKTDGTKEEMKLDQKEAKEKIANLIEKTIKKAATLDLAKSATPQSTSNADGVDKKEFKVTSQQLTLVIKKAVDTKKELVEALKANGAEDFADAVENSVQIDVTSKNGSKEDVGVELDADAVKALGASNVGVEIKGNGIDIKLPAALLAASNGKISVTTKPVSKEDRKGINTETTSGVVKELQTIDTRVATDGEQVKGVVELSFPINNMTEAELENLMVGVFEGDKWEKIQYVIQDGQVVFTAPHFSIYSLMTFESSFEDISDSWAKKLINALTAQGIVDGKDGKTFDPNGDITRAEFAKLLVGILGLENEVTTNYTDVQENTWYYDVVAIAGMNSLASGSVDGQFFPEDNITREDMAVMLVKAYEIKNGFKLTGKALPFSDNVKISEKAKDSVYAAKSAGIIEGYGDNTFRPENTATRAEAVKIIFELMNN